MKRMRSRFQARRLWQVVLLAVVAWYSADPSNSFAQSTETDEWQNRVDAAAGFLDRVRERQGITGLSAAVAIDGALVWSAGFGFADAERAIPASATTVYRVGSVSKVLTVGALLKLVESGDVDLDADIRTYVPEFPDKGTVITTRQLAGHLSGIRHYRRGESREATKRYTDVIEALEPFKDDPLVRQPGEQWSYSSYAWTLIAAVVQRAAGQPFQKYMRTALFEPLCMKHTDVSDPTETVDGLTAFYDHGEPVVRTNISHIWAGGGFLSTAEDLATYGSAFLPQSNFFSEETLRLVAANQRDASGEEIVHSIGWMTDRRSNGEHVLYHGGTILGGHSVLYVEPANNVVVAILANEAAGFGLDEAYIVASQLIGRSELPKFVIDSRSQEVRARNRERLLEAIDTWVDGLTNTDLEQVMSVVSEEFRSEEWASKDALSEVVTAWIAAGPIEIDGELDIGVRGVKPGSSSDVSGMRLLMGSGEVNLFLLFTLQEDGHWKLTEIKKP